MITIEELITELEKYPKDALCFTYREAVVIIGKDDKEELGYVIASE